VADMDEMDSFGMLREDWGSAYHITREAPRSRTALPAAMTLRRH
jgi:hypothetical protein